MTDDDLISEVGFEWGQPPHQELLEHECQLLESKLESVQMALKRSLVNVAGLVIDNRMFTAELATLKAEHLRITKRLAEVYAADRTQEIARMTYSYGDHTNK
jgi:hypothetical protein